MSGAEFSVSGTLYIGVILLGERWWIAYAADDPNKVLRMVQADE